MRRGLKGMSGQTRAISLLAAAFWFLAAWPASSDSPRAPDFRKGALYGKVVDAASGQPVTNAKVALRNKRGEIVAWTRTDSQGQYAVAADTLKLLQLHAPHHRGLLSGFMHGVGQVVTAPVKVAGAVVGTAVDVVKEVDPVRTATSAAVSSVTANPGPLASQVAGSTMKALTNKAEKTAQQRALKTMAGERHASRQKESEKKKQERLQPGEVFLAVSAPSYQEAKGKAGAYWLEPPARIEDRPMGPRAWLETVKLAPEGSDKKSEIENTAVLLAEPQLDPPLAPAGSPVKISVKLQTPEGQALDTRVFAREAKRHQVVELKPQGKDVFAGELPLDPKTPTGDTTVTVVALRSQPVAFRLGSRPDAMLQLVKELDELDPRHPYAFDPRVMASENRLDLPLTILDPKAATPPTVPLAPTPPVTSDKP